MITVDQQSGDDLRAIFLALSSIAREQWNATPDLAFADKGEGRFDPVTALDRDIEAAMRTRLIELCPDDAVWGEEGGWTNRGAARTWSLDPVDGTRALICGLPSWAVLVGLIVGDRHVAGMIDLPVLDERLIAIDGTTTANDRPVTTSGCAAIGSARLSTTDPMLFTDAERRAFERVRDAALVTRYGLDALAYARIATGGIHLVIEGSLGRHDLDALVAVVRGAGGHIGDWSGGEDWDGGRIVAAASRALYDEAVALLAE